MKLKWFFALFFFLQFGFLIYFFSKSPESPNDLSARKPLGKIKQLDWEGKGKIFVCIASYRDPELTGTIENMLQTAKYPDNLHLSVCMQDGETELDRFKTLPFTSRKGFSFIPVIANQSKGACWARAQSQAKYRGEEYTLHIDSHTRFVPHWDDLLITWLQQLINKGHPKPLISTYPLPYTPGETPEQYLKNNNPTSPVPGEFNEAGIFSFGNEYIQDFLKWELPIPSWFIAGGFSFTFGKWIEEVPYDPNLYFIGEEISISVRSWTHGWDSFFPHRAVVYHAYSVKVGDRTKHWEENTNWWKQNEISFKRVQQLFGMQEHGLDLGIYTLGQSRSISEYQKRSGVDFLRRVYIPQHARDKGNYKYVQCIQAHQGASAEEASCAPNDYFVQYDPNEKDGKVFVFKTEKRKGWMPKTNLRDVEVKQN